MMKMQKLGAVCPSAAIALCAVLYVQSASAAIECRFNNGKGGSTTLVNGNYSGTMKFPTPKSGESYWLASFQTTLTPTVKGNCSLGNDGENLWAKTATDLIGNGLFTRASFKTNIPGVEYQAQIETTAGIGNTFAQNTGDYQVIVSNDGRESDWDGYAFRVTIMVYLKDSFQGNPNKETYLRPKAGLLGWASLGKHGDSNNQPYAFYITENTFAIPIVQPTCSVIALGNGGTNIAMGDYFISDFKNNYVNKDVPFSLKVSDCSSVAKFTTKMTTTKITGGTKNLLGNSLTANAAAGMGVKILYNKNIQLIPNNANSSYVVSDSTIPGSKSLNFIARMESDGNSLVSGAYKATAVFNMTYD